MCGMLIVSGCNGHPEGMKEFRRLTEEEKDKLVEIALGTEDAPYRFRMFSACHRHR